MTTNSLLSHAAGSARVFMTLLLVFVAVTIVQVSVIEIVPVFWPRYPAAPRAGTGDELSDAEKRAQRILHARKEFLPDGTLHLVTESSRLTMLDGGNRSGADSAEVQIHDVNDRLLWTGPRGEVPYDYLSWAQRAHRDLFTAPYMRHVQVPRSENSRSLAIPVARRDELLELWRYTPWDDVFVGYDVEGGRLGHLGADGLADSASEARPFGPFESFLAWWPSDSYSPRLLWQTERRIDEIDFERRQVEAVFASAEGQIDTRTITITRWDSYRAPGVAARGQSRPLLHCQTEDGVHHVILREPNETIAVVTPEEWKQWHFNMCDFAAADEGVFMRRLWGEYPAPTTDIDRAWRLAYRQASKTQWVELYRVSPSGTLDPVNRFSWRLPGEEIDSALVEYRDPRSYVKPYVLAFSPLVADLVWPWALRIYQVSPPDEAEWRREFAQLIETIRPGYSVWNWLVTAAILLLTFVHARPRSVSRGQVAFWLALVALLNVVGFLSYWALHHSPLIRCAQCGWRRGLGQSACPRCEGLLATPERSGHDLLFGL